MQFMFKLASARSASKIKKCLSLGGLLLPFVAFSTPMLFSTSFAAFLAFSFVAVDAASIMGPNRKLRSLRFKIFKLQFAIRSIGRRVIRCDDFPHILELTTATSTTTREFKH